MPPIHHGPFTSTDRNQVWSPLSVGRRGERPERAVHPTIQLVKAEKAIRAKAAQLGWTGNPLGPTKPVAHGFVRPFVACDVYYSPASGAHEVHGDIRKKYELHTGAEGHLGFPTTDERGTADGVGAFNHFVGGSIYFSPATGPMMVQGRIRDHWVRQNAESGSLGYPVEDEHRYVTASPEAPMIRWSLFERGEGAVVETAEGVANARAVIVEPAGLRTLVRTKIAAELQRSSDHLRLHAAVETASVSDWEYGFWKSRDRVVTFVLHGFRAYGPVFDAELDLTVGLRFSLSSTPAFSEEALTKTAIMELAGLTVTAAGVDTDELAHGVAQAIKDAFAQPLRLFDLPTGRSPDIIGMMVGTDGSLRILVNPFPGTPDHDVGAARQRLLQDNLDAEMAGLQAAARGGGVAR